MIPKFLLNLSADSIALEHRSSAGTWVYLGEVKLDHPDLTSALKKLHELAQTDSEKPLEVMVALPTDQIKTLHLEKIGLARADIVAALEGQTPYDVSELCLDWVNTKAGSAIAAVARDTLNDVAVFAQGLNFSASMFVALPRGNWNNNFAIFNLKECPTDEVLLRLPPYISKRELEKSPKLVRIFSAKSHQQPADIANSFATRTFSIKKPLPASSPVILANHISYSTAQSADSIQTNTYASNPSVGAAKPVRSGASITVNILNPCPDTTTENTQKLLIPSTEQKTLIKYKKNKFIKIVTWAPKRQKNKKRETIPVQECSIKVAATVGGKPRYLGIFLTTLLLTFMLTVAAWATTAIRAPNTHAHKLLPTANTLPEATIIAMEHVPDTIPDKKIKLIHTMKILSKGFDIASGSHPKARPKSFELKIKKVSLTKFSTKKLMMLRPISRQNKPIHTLLTELAVTTSLHPEMRPKWIKISALALASTVAIQSEDQTSTAKSEQPVKHTATIKNILDFHNMNLIGVFGNKHNLNALVRLANGKILKVKIGDRLNGGHITNIQTMALTYEKSGLSVTLKMPRG